jgi:hypothetical protein
VETIRTLAESIVAWSMMTAGLDEDEAATYLPIVEAILALGNYQLMLADADEDDDRPIGSGLCPAAVSGIVLSGTRHR